MTLYLTACRVAQHSPANTAASRLLMRFLACGASRGAANLTWPFPWRIHLAGQRHAWALFTADHCPSYVHAAAMLAAAVAPAFHLCFGCRNASIKKSSGCSCLPLSCCCDCSSCSQSGASSSLAPFESESSLASSSSEFNAPRETARAGPASRCTHRIKDKTCRNARCCNQMAGTRLANHSHRAPAGGSLNHLVF